MSDYVLCRNNRELMELIWFADISVSLLHTQESLFFYWDIGDFNIHHIVFLCFHHFSIASCDCILIISTLHVAYNH